MQVTAWSRTWMEKAQAELRRLDDAQRAMLKQRGPLVEKARLLGGAERRTGWRVVPTLDGGEAKLRVSYEISGARWYPSYDIQLHPESGRVEIHFAGEVSQETGEDWSDAALTLSTAVPAASTRLPRLHTWKVGERERFVPAPPRVNNPVRPPPPALPPERASREEDEGLRTALLQRAGATQPTLTPAPQDSERDQAETMSGKHDEGRDRDGDGIPDGNADVSKGEPAMELAKKPAPPSVEQAEVVMAVTPTVTRARRSRSYAAEAPAAPEPTEQIGLLPPPGWHAPTWDPNLPAALAGGWDLSYPALAPETIASGKGARRVALFARSWPVTAERKLFPALADEAYPGRRDQEPVARGAARRTRAAVRRRRSGGHRDAGDGRARRDLHAAARPRSRGQAGAQRQGHHRREGHHQQGRDQRVRGHHRDRQPVSLAADGARARSDSGHRSARRRGQALALRAGGAGRRVKGELAWRVTVPPSGRTAVTFTYSLKRPKGWRLHQ